MKKRNKAKDYIDELSSMIPEERAKRAKQDAEREIFQIRLSELRKRKGLKQEDLKSFSQSSISKLESRKDMKLSTLIDYLSELEMGLEIKVYSKTKSESEIEEQILLKT